MKSEAMENFLTQPNGPNIGIIDEVDLTTIFDSCEAHNINCIVLDGKKIHSQRDLLDFLNIYLRFPDYFGFNWDALWDSLLDLLLDSGRSGIQKKICLIYTHAKIFLNLDLNNFFIFIEMINDLAEYQGVGNVFKLIVEINKKDFERNMLSHQESGRGRNISYSLLG